MTWIDSSGFLLLFFFGSLFGVFWSMRFKKSSIIVELKVVKQKANVSASNLTFAPVFEVVSDVYTGKQAQSNFGTSFGFHSVGSYFQGLYNPKSGHIESNTTLGVIQGLSVIGLLVSGAYLCWVNFIASVL